LAETHQSLSITEICVTNDIFASAATILTFKRDSERQLTTFALM